MPREKRTDQDLQEVSDHLYYEIWMLTSLAHGIKSGIAGEGPIANALLEAFVTHVRVLIDFLYNESPQPDDVIAEDFKTAFPRLRIDETSYLVIATRKHQYDELVLEMAVKTPARYIGMLGSKAKIETVFAHLLDRGIPEQLLNNVHTPIGLAIRSKTPPEIAISILAEIIKIRHSCP